MQAKTKLFVLCAVLVVMSVTMVSSVSAYTMLDQQHLRATASFSQDNPNNPPITSESDVGGTFTSYYVSPGVYIVRFDGSMGCILSGGVTIGVQGGVITGYGVSPQPYCAGIESLGSNNGQVLGFVMAGIGSWNVWVQWTVTTGVTYYQTRQCTLTAFTGSTVTGPALDIQSVNIGLYKPWSNINSIPVASS